MGMSRACVVLVLLCLSSMSAVAAPGSPPPSVGMRTLTVASSLRGEDLAVTLWYPVAPGGQLIDPGESRVFQGTPAVRNAPPMVGRFPLILLSHGSGSTVQGMAWIASALARAGFVVAGPNHPGTTSGDSTPQDTPELWERTDDLSRILSHLTKDPVWSAVIDGTRVGVLGFSLGGAAALDLVGGRPNREAYARYCETYSMMPDCRWFVGGEAFVKGEQVTVPPFDLRSLDKARFEGDHRDPRVTAAVLVDPSMAQAFDPESLRAIPVPLAFVNLGAPGTVPISVASDQLARLAPRARLTHVAGAVHYSFLPECREGARAFLQQVGETTPLCEDAGTRSRAALHAELAETITAAFTEMFAGAW
ncbi:alpha/beta hydrolase family protein [Rhodospirillum sp. A1_3_36]|uniref:alpha/beta hydrolase family protein n=1 Tax=Rhodospirillum sp. A1_3_36 TaxID=3391666 RepID=UPI0039A55251